jgi:hypothetical protein
MIRSLYILDVDGDCILSKSFPTVERRVRLSLGEEKYKDCMTPKSAEEMRDLFSRNVIKNEHVESSIDYPLLVFTRLD